MKEKFKKIPPINLACANDEIRPIMQHILITKNKIVASDSHILVEFETNIVFSKEFIDTMPDRFLISSFNWKYLTKKHLEIQFVDNFIEIIYSNNSIRIPITFEDICFNFPNYQKIFEGVKIESVDSIGIKPFLLEKIRKIIDPYSGALSLHFNGKSNFIEITSPNKGIKAILMPCMMPDNF